jgi:hypothetical protein
MAVDGADKAVRSAICKVFTKFKKRSGDEAGKTKANGQAVASEGDAVKQ